MIVSFSVIGKKKKKDRKPAWLRKLLTWFRRCCDRSGPVPAARPASSAPGGDMSRGVSTEAPARPSQPPPATLAPGAALPAAPACCHLRVTLTCSSSCSGSGQSRRAASRRCGLSAAAFHNLTAGAEWPGWTLLSPAPVPEQLLHSHIEGSVQTLSNGLALTGDHEDGSGDPISMSPSAPPGKPRSS